MSSKVQFHQIERNLFCYNRSVRHQLRKIERSLSSRNAPELEQTTKKLTEKSPSTTAPSRKRPEAPVPPTNPLNSSTKRSARKRERPPTPLPNPDLEDKQDEGERDWEEKDEHVEWELVGRIAI